MTVSADPSFNPSSSRPAAIARTSESTAAQSRSRQMPNLRSRTAIFEPLSAALRATAATSVEGWPSGVTGHEEHLSGILTGMLMTKLRPDGAPRLAGRDRLQRRQDWRSPHADALLR